jgi:RimJ/RimL family protein N-acetyltransferase
MPELPMLQTPRLILRPLNLTDAPDVQEFVGAWEVARYTLSIPHPYPEGAAATWIAGHQAAYDTGHETTWAITARAGERLLGVISLRVVGEHRHGEIGYWIGVPFWNRGYMTEAAGAVLDHGFGALGLHRIYATHFGGNPASGRVMQKVGMRYEGCLREHVWRWGEPQDLLYYGILRADWEASRRATP